MQPYPLFLAYRISSTQKSERALALRYFFSLKKLISETWTHNYFQANNLSKLLLEDVVLSTTALYESSFIYLWDIPPSTEGKQNKTKQTGSTNKQVLQELHLNNSYL